MRTSVSFGLAIVAVVLCVSLCAEPVQAGWGSCPSGIPTQANFEPSKYLGKWYELARFNYTFENNGFCVNANYSLLPNGHVKVFNEERTGSITAPISSATGDATIDPKDPAKLTVKFGGSPVGGPYWVVYTDYENVAMVYGCFGIEIYHYTYAWILSRTPVVPKAQIDNFVAKMESLTNVDKTQWFYTPQDGCTY